MNEFDRLDLACRDLLKWSRDPLNPPPAHILRAIGEVTGFIVKCRHTIHSMEILLEASRPPHEPPSE